MIVVEVILGSVIKEHLPNLTVECVLVDVHFNVELLKSLGCGLPEFEKAIFARKPIGLQQNFVLAVVNYVSGEMLGFGMLTDVLVHSGHHTPIGRRVAARS
jgi:hypothetical protein